MDPECIGLLCELHKKMINDAKADDPTDPLAVDGKARGATPPIPHARRSATPHRVCASSLRL